MHPTPTYPTTRLRRNRHNDTLRAMMRETHLSMKNFIYPLFVRFGEGERRPIHSMPEIFQLSVDNLPDEVRELVDLGVSSVMVFGIPEHKDALGTASYAQEGIVQQAIATIKDVAPDMMVISDVCLCEYTDHGHCGVVDDTAARPTIHNDRTLELLGKQAISHVKAGADLVAPSGMMDGMVAAIRGALDSEQYVNTPIMSYSCKFASSFYGPFRDAAEGAPQFGHRKTYQLDFANRDEALREAALDVQEGADMLMVKPASPYLDVVERVKSAFPGVPLGAYQVSGEYAMLKAAAEQGWLEEKSAVIESLTGMKRAGADFIISYYTKQLAYWL